MRKMKKNNLMPNLGIYFSGEDVSYLEELEDEK